MIILFKNCRPFLRLFIVYFPSLQNPVYLAGDEGTDESSTEDVSRRRTSFKGSIVPSPSVTDGAPQLTSSARLLSDLDAGYADDIDEAEDDDTLRSCSDKGHRKSRHHSRHHNPMDSTTISTNRSTWLGLGPDGDEVQDEPLVTPAMLISSSLSARSSPAVGSFAAPARQPNLTDSTKSYPNKVSECSTENPSPIKNNNDFTSGLTKEQLREALVHLIQV